MFIAFEGPEGGGKTTQVGLLRAFLERGGRRVVVAREPGGTPVGEVVRTLVKDKTISIPARSEFLLFQAARAAFVDSVVRPALERGDIVLADRFALSTMAYQVGGRGLPESECREMIRFATGGLEPNKYILLMVPPHVGRDRKAAQGHLDRFEVEADRYHQRVYEAYIRFVAPHPDHIIIHTDSVNREETHERIIAFIQGSLL